jgi:hypothetical protein
VAVCAVNVPGFPVPRARVAAGMPLALVAAGVEPLVEMAVEREVEGDGDVLQALEDDDTRVRLQQLEGIIASIAVGRRLELREQIDAERVEQRERKIRRSARNGQMRKRGLAASARREADAQILRDRVHVVTASAPPATTTELRARVHGGVVATATSTWDSKKREAASKKGQALPDGSFPIADKKDVQKAIQASGRSKHPAATVRKHIIKRAKALGAMDLIPDDWK